MKKIIMLGMVLLTVLVSLSSCYWPYHDHDRDRDHDRGGGYHHRDDRDERGYDGRR